MMIIFMTSLLVITNKVRFQGFRLTSRVQVSAPDCLETIICFQTLFIQLICEILKFIFQIAAISERIVLQPIGAFAFSLLPLSTSFL